MTLLVTGVAGFIGSNFVDYYLDKYRSRRIVGLDKLTYAGNLENLANLSREQRERFIFIKGDINDKQTVESLFEKHNISGIINFAAESHVDRSIHDPQVFLKTNILGTQTLLDTAKSFWYKDQWSGKFLQVSTDEVYGSLGATGHFTEKTPLDPRSPYSASKAAADLIVRSYNTTYNMPVIITRCSNNYGQYQFPEKLIPLMINNALNHDFLPVYGDGKQIRDWIHVDDHCTAIDVVFEKGTAGEVYNIGGQSEYENIDIVRSIIRILQELTDDSNITENLIKHIEDRPGHDRRYAIDFSKMSNELNWKPVVRFDDGLRKIVQWYLENQKWLKSVMSGDYRDFYRKNYLNRDFE